VREIPEVVAVQTYAGTAKPFDFNGMVRHYYLRAKPWQGEVQVQLTHKKERDRTSHQIAVEAREMLAPLARDAGARITVVEMPPGPPVLQAVVAEVYGPDAETRRQVAADLTRMMEETEGLADVDNYMQQPHKVLRFEVDAEKAVRLGVPVDTVIRNLDMALGGFKLGDVKRGSLLEPTFITLEVPLAVRSQPARLADLPVPTMDGRTVPLAELGRFVEVEQDPIVYHKDLRPMEYVVADAVGRLGAPLYPMLKMEERLEDYVAPDGVPISGTFFTGAPPDNGQSGFEWGGEWTVTYETFRDMGLAFGVALVLIYMLVVAEFGNFVTPGVIMAPIPLTLLGIVPGHWIMGADFTATSMIGFIALAGIIVRNSILLVDFSIQEVERGASVKEAVINACKARTRPILITAFALVAGSSVILTDPIFQGMAISLLFGVLVSTLLTLVVIPLGCVSAGKYLVRH
jgi:multidrug efflux pump subunit AcrB